MIKKHRWLIAAYVLCAIAALLPVWTVKYLPMIDLPQHAAQISIIKNLNNPAFGFAEQFELHWFIPYVLPTLLTLLPSYFVGVFSAVKLSISLYVLFLPLSMCFLFRETKGDPWWGLAGFCLSYGFCFYWGFLIYLMALPVGIFYLILGLRYTKAPTFRWGVGLFILGLCLFFCHAIVYGITNLILAAIFWKPRHLRPLLYQLPVPLFWVWINHLTKFDFNLPTEWDLNVWQRLVDGPSYFMGSPEDGLATLGGLALFAALLPSLRRPVTNEGKEWRWVPLILFFGAPLQVFGIYFVYQRAAFFVLIVWLMTLERSVSLVRQRASHAALVLFTLVWMIFLVQRFRLFNVDAADFDRAVKNIPGNSRILDLSFEKDSPFSRETFSHFAAWIQMDRGGVLGYSFGYYYNIIAQYRHGKAPLPFWAGTKIHWDPMTAKIYDTRSFDYFIVRSYFDPSKDLAVASPAPKKLMSNEGMWWVYQSVK